MSTSTFSIRPAQPSDVAHIHAMIIELAVFEKLEHMVIATEALLHEGLFGARPACEAIIGEENGEVVTFALFFHNFSTFLTRKGLYLEDLYVKQSRRGKGYGRAMTSRTRLSFPQKMKVPRTSAGAMPARFGCALSSTSRSARLPVSSAPTGRPEASAPPARAPCHRKSPTRR